VTRVRNVALGLAALLVLAAAAVVAVDELGGETVTISASVAPPDVGATILISVGGVVSGPYTFRRAFQRTYGWDGYSVILASLAGQNSHVTGLYTKIATSTGGVTTCVLGQPGVTHCKFPVEGS